jgi:TetR/AcrR family transcriptional regulator, lmrAB and yxaGH operons repressor
MGSKLPDKSRPTRDRILSAAKKLFQQRGYYAVGTAEILKAAHAPKGSMYHHFPDGKEQIAIEAVKKIRADVLAMMRRLETEQRPAAEIVRHLAKGMAQWLKQSRWREGTLLASIAVGSVPALPKLHAIIRVALDEWREHFAAALVREKWRRAQALAMAQTIIASLEGAMIVARIDQDERVVLRVAETLADLIERN